MFDKEVQAVHIVAEEQVVQGYTQLEHVPFIYK